MKTIVNNLAVEYADAGKGPVLLLLHGWMETLHTFDVMMPTLTAGWRVIRFDLPGFGGTEPPPVPWEVVGYAQFTADFCHKLGIQPKVIVGHSFGGRVILKGVSDSILTAQKLILIASAGIASCKTIRARLFLIAAKLGKIALFFFPHALQERLRKKLFGAAGSSDYLNVNSGVLKETFLKAIREDLSDAARSIRAPTLFIWGERDIVTPLSDGKRLHGLISGSKLEIIKGVGHFVHQEKPQAVAEAILRFAT